LRCAREYSESLSPLHHHSKQPNCIPFNRPSSALHRMQQTTHPVGAAFHGNNPDEIVSTPPLLHNTVDQNWFRSKQTSCERLFFFFSKNSLGGVDETIDNLDCRRIHSRHFPKKKLVSKNQSWHEFLEYRIWKWHGRINNIPIYNLQGQQYSLRFYFRFSMESKNTHFYKLN
jgi:hypothetical protein